MLTFISDQIVSLSRVLIKKYLLEIDNDGKSRHIPTSDG